ncbi:hypothetical protein BDW22DRAFT_1363555 [Trametopsis cervina]|nr:hypothetical protein BDW22DRAFT_1363555 [Trametopsis cervina]
MADPDLPNGPQPREPIPADVVQVILEYLTDAESTRASCSLVSRMWSYVSYPCRFRTVHFSYKADKSFLDFIQFLEDTPRARIWVVELYLGSKEGNDTRLSPYHLQYILKFVPNLRYLNIVDLWVNATDSPRITTFWPRRRLDELVISEHARVLPDSVAQLLYLFQHFAAFHVDMPGVLTNYNPRKIPLELPSNGPEGFSGTLRYSVEHFDRHQTGEELENPDSDGEVHELPAVVAFRTINRIFSLVGPGFYSICLGPFPSDFQLSLDLSGCLSLTRLFVKIHTTCELIEDHSILDPDLNAVAMPSVADVLKVLPKNVTSISIIIAFEGEATPAPAPVESEDSDPEDEFPIDMVQTVEWDWLSDILTANPQLNNLCMALAFSSVIEEPDAIADDIKQSVTDMFLSELRRTADERVFIQNVFKVKVMDWDSYTSIETSGINLETF